MLSISVWISARWIGNHGFSIGIDDVQPSQKLHNQKEEIINLGADKCDEKIKLYNMGSLPPEPGCDAAQSLEARITQILNGIRDATGKVRLRYNRFFFVQLLSIFYFLFFQYISISGNLISILVGNFFFFALIK